MVMDFFIENKKILLVATISWIIFVAFWSFRTNPPYWYDEGIYHQIATNLNDFGKMGVRLSPATFSGASLITVGYPVFYPAVVFFKLFGDSVAVLRMTAIAFLFGFFIVVYLLVKDLYGSKNAVTSVLLISLFSPLYGNGKTFLGEVPGMFYFVFGLLVLTRALKSEKKSLFIFFAGGFLLGLAASSKPNFLVILPALAVGIVWKWREFLSAKGGRRQTAALLAGAGVALAVWFLTQFEADAAIGRVFAHYSNPYYIQDIWPVIFVNLKRFIFESTPLHFLLLLLVAGFVSMIKIQRRISLHFTEVVIAAFIGAIIIFYVRTVGWYRYFFPAHLLLFIFFPAGVEFIIENFFETTGSRSVILFLFIIALLSSVQMLVMSRERFKIGPDEPTVFDKYFATFDKNKLIFFYSVPDVAARYSSLNFYQYIKMSDFLALGSENLDLAGKGVFDRVIMRESVGNFSFPSCYVKDVEVGKIIVLKRDYKLSCD